MSSSNSASLYLDDDYKSIEDSSTHETSQENYEKPYIDFRIEGKEGRHGMYSPIVGSRASELELIYAHRSIFSVFQKEVYDNYKLNLIPITHQERAEQIAEGLFSDYLKKYKCADIRPDNVVDWHNDDFNKTHLYDLENQWNTWRVHACVSRPFHACHTKDNNYRSAYVVAFHELMHVEETPIGIQEVVFKAKYYDIVEVLTVTKTIILMDEVYKRTLEIPLEIEVDYDQNFELFGTQIHQGRLANFYRDLEHKYPTLAHALVSPESLAFLGVRKPQHQFGFFADALECITNFCSSCMSSF